MINLELNTLQASAILQLLDAGIRSSGLNSAEHVAISTPVIQNMVVQYREAVAKEQADQTITVKPGKEK